ncbi:MAG: cell division protein FtsH, partial [Muribaculaceae bacterium]
KIIDEEVSRIIAEQYERAKEILSKHAEGHKTLTEVLLSREVIFAEDVEKIFGKRAWTSRSDEIMEQSEQDAKKEVEDVIDDNNDDVTESTTEEAPNEATTDDKIRDL